MAQIRLNKTPEIEQVLDFLRSKYGLLSEAEIIKVALAEKYKKELTEISFVDNETEALIAKGLEDIKHGRLTKLSSEEEIENHLNNL